MNADKLRDVSLRECERLEKIDEAGAVAAQLLVAGETVELALAPGNGTRYCFLIVPIDATHQHGDAGFESRGIEPPGGVWFAWLNGPVGIYPVKLLGRGEIPAPYYIAEKWNEGNLSADVFVIERLFTAIAENSKVTA